jgi:hypothetical protein
MSPLRVFKLTAVAVFAAGLVMAAAGGTMSAWAWTTPGTHIAFRIALPLLTAWLLFTMVRLALDLPQALKDEAALSKVPDPLTALAEAPRKEPDALVRRLSPDATFVRQISLPREPERRRRRRVAQRIELRDGRFRYRVAPVPKSPAPKRIAVAALLLVAGFGLFFTFGPIDLEDVSWIASLFRALEELPGLFEPVEAIGLLPALGFGACRDQDGL